MAGRSGLLYRNCTAFVGSHGVLHKVRGETRLHLHAKGGDTRLIREPVVSVVQGHLNNYYHFVAEGLVKLVLLLEAFTTLRQPPSLADPMVLLLPQHKLMTEIVDALGINSKRVQLYEAGPSLRWHFTTLTTVDWAYPPDVRQPGTSADAINAAAATEELAGRAMYAPSAAFFPPRSGLRLLSMRLLKAYAVQLPSVPPSNAQVPVGGAAVRRQAVYVTRNGTRSQMRMVEGSHRLVDVLRTELGAGAVTVFEGHRLPFREQMAVFQRAQLIVGAHGAGLTNAIFASPASSGTPAATLVELPLRNAPTYAYFGHIAAAVGLDYWVLPGMNSSYTGSVVVTDEAVDDFRAFLRLWKSEGDDGGGFQQRTEL